MPNDVLANIIREKALEAGFDGCGIIPIGELDAYGERLQERLAIIPDAAPVYGFSELFCNLQSVYPWAKSVIVCTLWYGRYRFPQSLQGKYAKSFLLSIDTVPLSEGRRKKIQFENWLRSQGLRIEGGDANAPAKILPLRHAAVAAGLGIFRRNNFFYGERGSYYAIEGYLTDRELELRSVANLKPCPEKCNAYQRGCKTHALSAPYVMNPLSCVSFWTTFGGGNVPPHLEEKDFCEWICGCDACQDACPYNRRQNWNLGEPFYGLDEIEELLQPENIIAASDEILCEKVVPKTENHVAPNQVETLRICARRSLRYRQSYELVKGE